MLAGMARMALSEVIEMAKDKGISKEIASKLASKASTLSYVKSTSSKK